MSTSREELTKWFDAGVKRGATHMIVVCDTPDHADFPVYVEPGEDPRKRAKSLRRKQNPQRKVKRQRVMGVYDLRIPGEPQLAEPDPVFNYESPGEMPKQPLTLCCGVEMMGLGGDPTRAVVCWNELNGVVSCHACGTIYVDSKDEGDYDRWKAAGGGMVQERDGRQPKYGVADRVTRAGDAEGRVQGVTHTGTTFRYLVKWDVGPTTPHDEAELNPATLPPHYP